MNKIIPTLYTKFINESVDFYCNILGFTCDALDEEYGWAKVSKDDAEIMFSLPNEHLPFQKPTFTGSIYVKTNNVESFWNSIKEDVKISYPLEQFDYGMKEFSIYDNNGYLIQFGEETN